MRPTVRGFHLRCRLFWVDARLVCLHGRWIASVDTPGGPNLGWGSRPVDALTMALQPFDGIISELVASAPVSCLAWTRRPRPGRPASSIG